MLELKEVKIFEKGSLLTKIFLKWNDYSLKTRECSNFYIYSLQAKFINTYPYVFI